MTKVSVIVPVYNAEKNLRTCLSSLINQTIDDIEIIAIDDASTDDSFEIMKEFVSRYSFVQIYHNDTNLGQGATRNKGISLAKGEYIGFVDSDDYVNINMYKSMYDAAQLNGCLDVIVSRFIFVNNDDYYLQDFDYIDEKGYIYDVVKNPDIVLSQSPSCWDKLFRRDLIENYMFLENVMWEDVAFTYASLFKSNKILIMRNLDYFYRRDLSAGISGRAYKSNDFMFDIFKITDEIENELKICHRYEIFKKEVKFLQFATIFQRILEISSWGVEDVNDIKNMMYEVSLKKYGTLDDVDKDLLSSRADLDIINEFIQFSQSRKQVK